MTIEQAIISALDYEHRVRDHYARSAERTQDPLANRIFARFAIEEQRHIDYLKAQLLVWRNSNKIDLELNLITPDENWITEGKRKISKVDLKSEASDLLDIMKKALILEREVSDHFLSLSEKLDGDARKMFERFVKIEEMHCKLIELEVNELESNEQLLDIEANDN